MAFGNNIQMAAMVLHTIAIPTGLAAFFAAFAIAKLRTVLLLYIAFMVLDPRAEKGAPLSPFQNFCRRLWWWKAFAGYFPVRLHRTTPLEPSFVSGHTNSSKANNRWQTWWHVWYLSIVWWILPFKRPGASVSNATGRKYIFGYHPHGIIGMGAVAALATEGCGWSELFPGIPVRLLTLASNFWFPFYREYILSIGLSSVSKSSCVRLLNNNQSICILIGGARESLLSQPHPEPMKLILQTRLGFVKVAVETGASLVPVIGFGEKEVYRQMAADSPFHRFMTRRLGFTIPIFFGRGIFNREAGLLPYRRPINVVVGKPIEVPKMANASHEIIEKIHARYVGALVELYEEHRLNYGYTEPLELVQ